MAVSAVSTSKYCKSGLLSSHESFNQGFSEDLGKGSRVRVVSNAMSKLRDQPLCKQCTSQADFSMLNDPSSVVPQDSTDCLISGVVHTERRLT